MAPTLTVDAASDGQRLDVAVSAGCPGLTRQSAQRLIEAGSVLVNGRPGRKSARLKAGDRLEVRLDPEVINASSPRTGLVPAPLPLDIRYEDEHLLVINKPAGIAVHPGTKTKHPTLVEGVLAHTRLSDSGLALGRPGVVHRLDADTTGLLVFAKDGQTHAGLAAQFQKKTNRRLYVALVFGAFKTPEIELTTGYRRHPMHRRMFQALSSDQAAREGVPPANLRQATSRLRMLKNFAHQLSYLEVALRTGRTHQIRVHCRYLGFPVVGDQLYAAGHPLPSVFTPEVTAGLRQVHRQLLHAYCLGFIHPRSGEWMEFTADVPPDFLSLLKLLEPWSVPLG